MTGTLRLLHLEDDSADAELVREALAGAGLECTITLVLSRQAFLAALADTYDLILVDNSIPGLDGAGAIAAARERAPDVPVIMVTGSLGEERAIETLRRGATDFVLKHRLELLGPAVRRALAEVDARRQRERAERELRATFEDAPIGMLLTVPEGEILRANRAACAMLGRSDVELHGLRTVDLMHPDERPQGGADNTALLEGTFAPPREQRYLTKSGAVVWVRRTLTAVRDPDGRPRYALVMFENVTDSKLAEARQASLEGQLRQAQKMVALGQFAGGIAHDFNNILTIVLAEAELALDAVPSDWADLRADVKAIADAAVRGREMIRRLLAFSRRDVLSVQELDLATLVREFAPTLRRLVPSNVELHASGVGAGTRVNADPAALEECLMNLATNARDAMPQGGVFSLSVRRERVGEAAAADAGVPPGDYAVLEVRDNGSGMDAGTRARAFDPLFTTKPEGKGTGLGLSMVLGLVQQHGGGVRLASEAGHGTVVEMLFPAVAAVPAAGASEGAPVPAGMEGPRGTEMLLVVDDEEVLGRATQRALERFGYKVLTAVDGRDALEIVRREGDKVRLIISDVSMPRMTGPDLYRAVRAAGNEVRFLFTSGYERPEVGALPGDVRAITKPWTIAQLAGAVRSALDT